MICFPWKLHVLHDHSLGDTRRRDRVTEDVDALTRDTLVLKEAQALARERGLPGTG
jgi:hypothetical protein